MVISIGREERKVQRSSLHSDMMFFFVVFPNILLF